MAKIPKRTDPNYITPWVKYKEQVHSITKPAGQIRLGSVYSLGYNFSKDYEYSELMWYDYMPLVYIVSVNTDKGYFTGINLHHFPVTFREQWFRSIVTGKKFGLPSFVETLLPFFEMSIPQQYKRYTYDRQKAMMWWVKYGVRNYRFERVMQARFVTPENTQTLLRLYADTFYAATGVDKVKHFYSSIYKK
jgi:hypothetical protein